MYQEQFQKNIEYIANNRDKLLAAYNGKYVIVFDQRILGSFDTRSAASAHILEEYGAESGYLIYHLTLEEQDSDFSTLDDRSKFPKPGHILGNLFAGDGKIVTNSGLRHTGWQPNEE